MVFFMQSTDVSPFPPQKCIKYFATFSAKCMELLQHRCSESEYHCLTHVGFQYELTKCALICTECKLLAKLNENTYILKTARSYLLKWIKELKQSDFSLDKLQNVRARVQEDFEKDSRALGMMSVTVSAKTTDRIFILGCRLVC